MANVKAIRSEMLSKPYDSRYVIVDIETGVWIQNSSESIRRLQL